jgi:hypothetical protein
MHLRHREWWALIHGIIFGAFFLLAFSGGLAGLWSLRTEWVTTEGLRERVRRLKIGNVTMALAAWGTVITGTWIVYPWYRSKYGAYLARNRTVRNIAIGFFVAAFATAAVAGIFGALITKAAPVH